MILKRAQKRTVCAYWTSLLTEGQTGYAKLVIVASERFVWFGDLKVAIRKFLNDPRKRDIICG